MIKIMKYSNNIINLFKNIKIYKILMKININVKV